jgi:hypothetical protein
MCAMPSEAYGTETMKKTSVFEQHGWFIVGQDNVEDVGSSGSRKTRRSDENVENELCAKPNSYPNRCSEEGDGSAEGYSKRGVP